MTIKPNRNGFFRYKLYHLPLWMVYHYGWWALAIGNPGEVAYSILFSYAAIKFAFYVVFQAIGVYFNLYFLIPRLLERGRYVPYVGLLLLTLVSTAACIVVGYYVSAAVSGKTFLELWGVEPENYFHFFKVNALPSTVASMTLAMSIKLTKNWMRAKQRQQTLEKRQQVLEKEKLETELKFLKSQFNPHFLFNTINSVFVLIHKNPAEASEALAKFSDLLRYQLYECNEQEIPLGQELAYLENFIELETLRQDTDTLSLDLVVEQGYDPDLTIAPFVLIPFIENAFKHVSKQPDTSNWIKLKLDFDDRRLRFTLANSISAPQPAARDILANQGIGLKNVQRRLDLLYPGEHQLSTERSGDQYCVSLSLLLREATVPRVAPVA